MERLKRTVRLALLAPRLGRSVPSSPTERRHPTSHLAFHEVLGFEAGDPRKSVGWRSEVEAHERQIGLRQLLTMTVVDTVIHENDLEAYGDGCTTNALACCSTYCPALSIAGPVNPSRSRSPSTLRKFPGDNRRGFVRNQMAQLWATDMADVTALPLVSGRPHRRMLVGPQQSRFWSGLSCLAKHSIPGSTT